jgi:biopolymer transport protein ExbD
VFDSNKYVLNQDTIPAGLLTDSLKQKIKQAKYPFVLLKSDKNSPAEELIRLAAMVQKCGAKPILNPSTK